jgi:hypothetical protein
MAFQKVGVIHFTSMANHGLDRWKDDEFGRFCHHRQRNLVECNACEYINGTAIHSSWSTVMRSRARRHHLVSEGLVPCHMCLGLLDGRNRCATGPAHWTTVSVAGPYQGHD